MVFASFSSRFATMGMIFSIKVLASDLIGIPVRLVVSEKTGEKVELKKREEKETNLLTIEEVLSRLK